MSFCQVHYMEHWYKGIFWSTVCLPKGCIIWTMNRRSVKESSGGGGGGGGGGMQLNIFRYTFPPMMVFPKRVPISMEYFSSHGVLTKSGCWGFDSDPYLGRCARRWPISRETCHEDPPISWETCVENPPILAPHPCPLHIDSDVTGYTYMLMCWQINTRICVVENTHLHSW